MKETLPTGADLATQTKRCSRCHKTLPIENFGSDKSKIGGKQPYCRKCIAEYLRVRRNNNIRKSTQYLEQFTDDQLIAELRERGYTGDIRKICAKYF